MSNSEEPFEIFFWNGQKRYKCNQTWESGAPCEYDTYDLELLAQHIRGPHNYTGDFPGQKPFVSPVLDERGKQIVRTAKPDDVPPEYRNARFKE